MIHSRDYDNVFIITAGLGIHYCMISLKNNINLITNNRVDLSIMTFYIDSLPDRLVFNLAKFPERTYITELVELQYLLAKCNLAKFAVFVNYNLHFRLTD